MKSLFKIGFIALFAFAMTGCQAQSPQPQATQTQIIAFVDAELIIPNMPEYKKAESDYSQHQEILQKQFEGEQAKLEQYYSTVMQKVQAGMLTPVQQKAEETKLMKMQEDLQKKTGQIQDDLLAKKMELEKPVYDKFNEALKAVATANKYTYIFDKKVFLFQEGGDDATDKVKAQLGVE